MGHSFLNTGFIKKSLPVLAVIFLFSCNQRNNADVREAGSSFYDEKAIQEVLTSQVNAWNRGDIDGFMEGYWQSDSLLFITGRGIRAGYQQVLTGYKKNYDTRDKMGVLTFDSLSFRKLSEDGKLAHVTGRWKISGKENAGGIFSLIFTIKHGKWVIITDHTW